MRLWKRLVLLSGLGLMALPLRAEGLYVLGALGAKSVSDQDFNDYYSQSYYSPYSYDTEGLGEGDLSIGWRFPGLMALEGEVGVDSGREASALTYDGNSTVVLNAMPTLSLGPVFCLDHPSWWFNESGVTEVGLRLEYSTLTGSETVDGYGSQDFNGSTLGFGIFVRDLNIWNPTGFNIGLEVGYDESYFNSLKLSDTSGSFAGNNGQTLTNYSGGNAYFDNSGGYVRLVIGWSQPGPSLPPQRPYWRRRAYRDYAPQDYQDSNPGPGNTIPSQPAPGGADDQNYGN